MNRAPPVFPEVAPLPPVRKWRRTGFQAGSVDGEARASGHNREDRASA